MAQVWYTGSADTKTIKVADWTALGVVGQAADVTWNATGKFSVSQATLSASALAWLATQSDFQLVGTDTFPARASTPSTTTPKTSAFAIVARAGAAVMSYNEMALVSTGGGAFALTLPPNYAGATVIVKKVDASANACTVTPQSGTIDGAANLVLNTQWQSRELICDGTNWYVR